MFTKPATTTGIGRIELRIVSDPGIPCTANLEVARVDADGALVRGMNIGEAWPELSAGQKTSLTTLMNAIRARLLAETI